MIRWSKWGVALAILAVAWAGCNPVAIATPTTEPTSMRSARQPTQEPPGERSESQPTQEPPAEMHLGYTHLRPDGNRFLSGRGGFPQATALDITLEGSPAWVVAAAAGSATIWVAALEDGRVQGFRIAGAEVEPVSVSPDRVAPAQPPLLRLSQGRPTLLTAPVENASPMSHPVPLRSGEGLAYIQPSGQVTVNNGEKTESIGLNALPDGRLLLDERDRVLFLSEATARYAHGVLGDDTEAAGVTLLDTDPSVRVASRIDLEGGDVVEGIAPIWTDLDGDGTREIIVTISNSGEGARVVVFDEMGNRVAAGPSVGQGFRWRHQLAAARFGPQGEVELADIITPHIGGVVEFYRLEADRLSVVARVPGFSSHVIGSRNLDMALAGDLDGDGRVELLAPNQGLTELAGIRRNAGGAEVAWTVPLGGRLSTNIGAAVTPNGDLVVGAGRRDGVLRVWLPR